MKMIKKTFGTIIENMENGEYTTLEILLCGVILFLVGVIVGLVTSNKHTAIGCYNGATYNDCLSEDECEE